MRKLGILFGVLAVVVFVGVSLVQHTVHQENANTLQVNEVGADPGAYVGEITLLGIKAAVSKQDASIFGIMDKQELQCTAVDCDKILIAIKYDGQMPVMGDEVRVTGSFMQTPDGYLFAAKDVHVLRNHTLGG